MPQCYRVIECYLKCEKYRQPAIGLHEVRGCSLIFAPLAKELNVEDHQNSELTIAIMML